MEEAKVKAQFMAQYYGVEGIAFGDGYERAFTVSTITLNSEHEYLLLRTVEQLTDGELIWCYHLHSAAIAYDYTQDFFPVLDMAKHWINNDGFKTLSKYRCTSDYLRSVGILLPFTCLNSDKKPITLQPSELISMGWAKIKTI